MEKFYMIFESVNIFRPLKLVLHLPHGFGDIQMVITKHDKIVYFALVRTPVIKL